MARRRRGRAVDGVLLLDKPAGLSSNRAMQRARHCFAAQKAGHTGSLDPLATGLLPVCLGEATKFSQFLLNADKAYTAEIVLGASTDSDDADGNLTAEVDAGHISQAEVEAVLAQFRGDIEQVPPMYSALKHAGQPLYKLARRGITLEQKPRRVTIHRLSLIEFCAGQRPRLKIEVSCSKGTYIRALARDIGTQLQVGAHIVALRRTMAGSFALADALELSELEQPQVLAQAQQGALDTRLLPVEVLVEHFPRWQLCADEALRMRLGQRLAVTAENQSGVVRLVCADGRFIGLGEFKNGCLAPKRLLAQSDQH